MARINLLSILVTFSVFALFLSAGISGVYAAGPIGPAELVSVDYNGNHHDTGQCYWASISSDGSFIAFSSDSPGLVPGGTIGQQIFLRDRQTPTTTLVSADAAGNPGNGSSDMPSINKDGNFIAFQSDSTNLMIPSTTGQQIFLRDRLATSNATTLVSVDAAGIQGTAASFYPSISDDGQYVAFMSTDKNLVTPPMPATSQSQSFVRDRTAPTTRLVSADNSGNPAPYEMSLQNPRISADGRYVAFWSWDNLLPADANIDEDVYLRDTTDNTTTLVSINSSGTHASTGGSPSINADGRYVAFMSYATDLVTPATSDQYGYQIFLRDTADNITTLVSADCNGNQGVGPINGSQFPSISADGRFVAFMSDATNLAHGGSNGWFQIYVRDTVDNTTAMVSVDPSGHPGNDSSFMPSISADGHYVAFLSNATNLIASDNDYKTDVYLVRLGPCTCQPWGNVTLSWTVANGQETHPGYCDEHIIIPSIISNSTVEVSATENCSCNYTLSDNCTVTNSEGVLVAENTTGSFVSFTPACADNYTVVFNATCGSGCEGTICSPCSMQIQINGCVSANSCADNCSCVDDSIAANCNYMQCDNTTTSCSDNITAHCYTCPQGCECRPEAGSENLTECAPSCPNPCPSGQKCYKTCQCAGWNPVNVSWMSSSQGTWTGLCGDTVIIPQANHTSPVVINSSENCTCPDVLYDVYFLADTTSSMGLTIDAVKTGASAIMNQLHVPYADMAFGVGNYKDFPIPPLGSNPYCFEHQLSPTTVVSDAKDAIDTWTAGYGGDNSDGQIYALHELATNPSINWRPGAKRIIVWFGDSPGHNYTCPVFTGSQVISELMDRYELTWANITVLAIDVTTSGQLGLNGDPTVSTYDYDPMCAPPGGAAGQATRITDVTYGSYTAGVVPTTICSTITQVVNAYAHNKVPVSYQFPASPGDYPVSLSAACGGVICPSCNVTVQIGGRCVCGRCMSPAAGNPPCNYTRCDNATISCSGLAGGHCYKCQQGCECRAPGDAAGMQECAPGCQDTPCPAGQRCYRQSACNDNISCLTDNININTGYNQATGSVYSVSQTDSYWILTGSPTGTVTVPRPAYIVSNTSWADSMIDTNWISAYPSFSWLEGNLEGELPAYSFTRCFCTCDGLNAVNIDLTLLVDNTAKVYFDNQLIGAQENLTPTSYLDPISITAGPLPVSPGRHCIRVDLRNTNDGSAMGLDIKGQVTAADPLGAGLFSSDNCCDPTGWIIVRKINDLNHNEVPEWWEPGLYGWTIKVQDGSGALVAENITDGYGYCYFNLPAPGTYTVSEVPQSPWIQSYPDSPGTHTVTLGVHDSISLVFGNYNESPTASVWGRKINDLSHNGIFDINAPGLPGWTIVATNIVTGDNTTTVTGADGSYHIDNLTPGYYWISEVSQLGWTMTIPGSPYLYSVQLHAGDNLWLNFGNYLAQEPCENCGACLPDSQAQACGYTMCPNSSTCNSTIPAPVPFLAHCYTCPQECECRPEAGSENLTMCAPSCPNPCPDGQKCYRQSGCGCAGWDNVIVSWTNSLLQPAQQEYPTTQTAIGIPDRAPGTAIDVSSSTSCNPASCPLTDNWTVERIASGYCVPGSDDIFWQGTGSSASFTPTCHGGFKVTLYAYCNGVTCDPRIIFIEAGGPPPSCTCLTWNAAQLQYTAPTGSVNPSIPYGGGGITIPVVSQNTEVQISSSINCSPTNINCQPSYTWTISGPISSNGSGSSTSFTPQVPGLYTVVFSAKCGNADCPITFSIPIQINDIQLKTPYSCSSWNPATVSWTGSSPGTWTGPCGGAAPVKIESVNAGTAVQVSSAVTCNPPDLQPTYDWSITSSSGSTVASGSGSTASFTPKDPGSYTAVFNASCGGTACQATCSIPIQIDRVTPRQVGGVSGIPFTCSCGAWGPLTVTWPGGSQNVLCTSAATSPVVSIPSITPGTAVQISSGVTCGPGILNIFTGENCPASVNWTVTSMFSGQGPWTGSGSTASFVPAREGSFIVVFNASCGNAACPASCKIHIDVKSMEQGQGGQQPSAPVIISFTPNRTQVSPQESVTLNWTIKGDGEATLECGGEKKNVAFTGSTVITPAQSGCCTLTASNKAGSDQKTSCITVLSTKAAPPHINSFTAGSTQVNAGDRVPLNWSISGDGEAYLTCAGQRRQVPFTGSSVISPTQSGCCTLVASNKSGSDQKTACITVLPPRVTPPKVTPPKVTPPRETPPKLTPPVINNFSASCPPTGPAARTPGTCTLSWSVTGPAGTTVTISGIGNVGLSGSRQVSRGSYTLTANGPGGSISRTTQAQ